MGDESEDTIPTRPMFWSVQRELWENRSIYIAPVVVAAVVVFGFLISTFTLAGRMRGLAALTSRQVPATGRSGAYPGGTLIR